MALEPEDIEVSIVTHYGHQSTPLGVVKIDMNQWIVIANGRHVGYIPKREGGMVMFLNLELPQAVKDAIKVKVDAILGHETPDAIDGAPILDEAFEDEEDDEELELE